MRNASGLIKGSHSWVVTLVCHNALAGRFFIGTGNSSCKAHLMRKQPTSLVHKKVLHRTKAYFSGKLSPLP